MKKKLTAIFLCVALVAIAIVGASLAYFTDTDQATNTFAVGNVKIELIEQQRGENGLVPFEQNKKLYPIVGSAQGDKDEYGMPIAKNYVDKIVTIRTPVLRRLISVPTLPSPPRLTMAMKPSMPA